MPQIALAEKPQNINKGEFLRIMRKSLREGEISWLITDERSFEWPEINQEKGKFLGELSKLKFSSAFVGVFYPETKEIEYSSFKITN